MSRWSLACLLCGFNVLVQGSKDIRLAGSLIALEGRVEVYHNGEWGTVCSSGWGSHSNNKDVVCRELGYARGRAFSHEYPGTGTVWLDGVVCSGNEGSILDCTHKPLGDTSCSHDQDVTVQCDVCQRPIISSAQNLVHDWSFSATTYRDKNPPHLARLKSIGAWCLPEVIDMQFPHYLEVELPRLYLVSAVATLGSVTYAEYVTSYKVVYSVDGSHWRNVSVDGRQEIKGNTAFGNDDVQTRILDNSIRAKFLRFTPLGWGSVACMRVEICGYQLPHYPTVLVKAMTSSAILSWSIPDSGDEVIKKYNVRYWKAKSGRTSYQMFESTANAGVVLPNLSPYMDYQLEISGVSELGEGLAQVRHFKTLETAPSGSPTRISFAFLGDTAVNITWAPPHEDKRNGDIIAYVICFPSGGKCENPKSVPGSQTWYVLRGGDFSSPHVVEIRAQTVKGTGPIGQATTGVLQYTNPDNIASSLIIAITSSVLLLALIVAVVLAAKGIILKNFVNALRKLTSSRITVSIKSDTNSIKTKAMYNVPEEETQTAAHLYNISNNAENVYDSLDNVRKQNSTMVEGNIYYQDAEQKRYDNSGNLLYNARGKVVYDTRDQTLYDTQDQIVYDTRDQIVYDTRDQIVYDRRDQTLYDTQDQIVYDTRDQIVYDTRDQTLYDTQDQIVHDTRDQIVYDTRDEIVYNTRDEIVYDAREQNVPISEEQSNTINNLQQERIYQSNISHNQTLEIPYNVNHSREESNTRDMHNSHDIYTAHDQIEGDSRDRDMAHTMQDPHEINTTFSYEAENPYGHVYSSR